MSNRAAALALVTCRCIQYCSGSASFCSHVLLGTNKCSQTWDYFPTWERFKMRRVWSALSAQSRQRWSVDLTIQNPKTGALLSRRGWNRMQNACLFLSALVRMASGFGKSMFSNSPQARSDWQRSRICFRWTSYVGMTEILRGAKSCSEEQQLFANRTF